MRKLAMGALAGAALAVVAVTARADNGGLRFEATASSENITLDQTVEVVVTLQRDGSQPVEAYRPPASADADLVHTGENEQVQLGQVGGRMTVVRMEQHVYVFRPRKRGAFTVSAASIRIGGVEVKTKPITVHVGPPLKNAISMSHPNGAAAGNIPAPEGLKGDEELFIDAQADKSKVYVGQQVTVSWRLFAQTDVLKYRPLSEPKYEDFWSEDLFMPQNRLAWDRAVINGNQYAVTMLLKKALFPLKAGKLAVTPLEAEATTMQTAFSPTGSGSTRSRALTIDVMPLPVAGRPAGFESPNVGRFELSSSVDRAAVKAGEAITWKVAVRGSGNIRNVRLPKLEHIEGFRVYEPTTKELIEPGDEVHGQKIYTYLLLPQKGGSLELPSVSLAYFDPEAGKYAVAKSTPVAITVEGDPTKVEGSASRASEENVLAQQVRPIRNRAQVRSNLGDRLFRGRVAYILLATPPGAWLLVLIVDALRRRLGRETAGSKRRRARRSARRRMRVAEYHIKAGRPSAFFGECARVLYEHLEYRLGAKVEALTLGELREHLLQRGFPAETVELVVKELENCDFARFAPSASGPGEMRAALRRVRALLGMIEKARPADREVAA